MKKRLIIISTVALVITATIIILTSILSKKEITFTLEPGDYTLQIRQKTGKEVTSLAESQKVTLSKGEYFYSVIGEGYDGKSTPLSVTDTATVNITPRYLESYIDTLERRIRPSAEERIKKAYPSVGVVTIDSFKIDKTATWGYGTLHIGNTTTDVYRYVLKRDGESWVIVVKPTIAINTQEAANVPKEILYSLY